MPSVFVSTPAYPNVPQTTGVPQVNRASNSTSTSDTATQATQSNSVLKSSQSYVWGVFNQNNQQVLKPDNIYSFSDRAEWRISDYPLQQGSFTTYNKVVVPAENMVRMTKGGSLSDRTEFLKSVNAICGDTNLYNIATPELTYTNVNIMRRELTRRSSEGAYFLEVDLYFRQINQQNPQYSSTTVSTANATNAADLPAVNQGTVQPSSTVSSIAQTNAETALTSAPQ